MWVLFIILWRTFILDDILIGESMKSVALGHHVSRIVEDMRDD